MRGVELEPERVRAAVARARRLAADRSNPGQALEEAIALIREAAQHLPPELRPHASRILWMTGFFEEAEALGSLAELAQICVRHDMPHSLIHQFPKVRSDADRKTLVEAHRQWGDRAVARAAARPITRAPRAGGDRIRLGLMSGDLRHHVVGHLAYPIFRFRDRRFELVAYTPSDEPPDAAQEWFASRVTRFSILPPDDRAAAEAIAADGLDVLIDLGGPTNRNRPQILAYRPAPLQLSWLGYPHSAGLPTIDGILLDRWLTPDRRDLLLEAPLPLPAWFALSPASFRPEPAVQPVPPSVRTGRVTFSVANDSYKFTPEALRAWARIVAATPGSRFRLIRHENACSAVRENFIRRFAAEGVSADRLDFPAVPPAFRGLYDDVDIALDTFPVSGGMTTCEALWMGVPTVTLMGEAVFERITGALMTGVGLDRLVARSVDEYVGIAVALAGDPVRLGELRHTMRERIAAHPLGQPEAFARGFYDLLASAVTQAQAR